MIDIPEPNDEAVHLAERLGFSKVLTAMNTYRGPAPTLPLDRIYGSTLGELQ